MEENPAVSMGRAGKIIRKSVHTFLQHYHFFTSTAALAFLPFSISVLLPQAFAFAPIIYHRLYSLFLAAAFPSSSLSSSSSQFLSFLSLKLSQTISSSIITLPFSLSFLLLAKATIIHFFITKKVQFVRNTHHHNSATSSSLSSSFTSFYSNILLTHLCNSFIIFAANATCFSLLFLAFNFVEALKLTSPTWAVIFSCVGAVFYSVVLAHVLVVSNLALVLSGIEKRGGIFPILSACVLMKGKTSTALALAVPVNTGLAAVEALFHLRIIVISSQQPELVGHSGSLWLLALEGVLIAYIYSVLLVVDVIMSCMFYQSCKNDRGFVQQQIIQHCTGDDQEVDCSLEVEDYCNYDYNVQKLKGIEEFV